MAKLRELSKIIRSKNAGALLLTIDIMFEEDDIFQKVISSNVLTSTLISKIYNINSEDVQIIEYPMANAIKITFPRPSTSGDPDDTDIYGAQQSAPLLDLEIAI